MNPQEMPYDPKLSRGFETAVDLEPLSDSLRFVLEAANIGWWDLDILANKTARSLIHDRMFGYDEMLASWSYDDYLAHVHADDRAMVARSFETAMAGGEPYAVDVRVVWPDGSVHWLFTRGRFLLDEDGAPCRVAGVVGEITERKIAETAAADAKVSAARVAAENLAMLETLLRSAPVGFAYVDRDLRFVRVNDFLAEINGIPADQALGQTVGSVVPHLWPQVEPLLHRVASEQVAIQDVPISGETLARPGVRREWLASYYPVCIDEAEEISGVGIIVQEVTEQRRLEANLRQAQRLEAVGRLAGGVAHDFNNMLAVILGRTELTLAQLGADDPTRASLLDIHNAAERSTDLTRQLLTFARQQPIEPRVVDPIDSVTRIAKLLSRLISEDIALTWNTDADVWPIKIDPSQFDQILTNLVVNARDAVTADATNAATISLSISNTVLDGSSSDPPQNTQRGDYVRVTVADNGPGLDDDTRSKIFEPFFTTKGTGHGLGLATVYGIVEQNNGLITLTSAPGSGATFEVLLPRHRGQVEANDARPAPHADVRTHETILVAEDEPAILKTDHHDPRS